MSNRHQNCFRPAFSNNHIERVGKVADMGPLYFNQSKAHKLSAVAGADWKHQWEQSLTCQCASGLPILKRAKRAGKWLAWCKKCDPSTKVKNC